MENIGEPWGTLKNIGGTLGEHATCVKSTSLSNDARKWSLLLQKIKRERVFFLLFSFEVWGKSVVGFRVRFKLPKCAIYSPPITSG